MSTQQKATQYRRTLRCIRCGMTWTTPKALSDTELNYLLNVLNVCPAGCYTNRSLKHITMEVNR